MFEHLGEFVHSGSALCPSDDHSVHVHLWDARVLIADEGIDEQGADVLIGHGACIDGDGHLGLLSEVCPHIRENIFLDEFWK